MESNITKKRKVVESTTSSNPSSEDIVKSIEAAVAKKTAHFDSSKDPNVKRIQSLLYKSKESKAKSGDLEGDFEMMDNGIQEVETKCPYSKMTFKEPMKRYYGNTVVKFLSIHCNNIIY